MSECARRGRKKKKNEKREKVGRPAGRAEPGRRRPVPGAVPGAPVVPGAAVPGLIDLFIYLTNKRKWCGVCEDLVFLVHLPEVYTWGEGGKKEERTKSRAFC